MMIWLAAVIAVLATGFASLEKIELIRFITYSAGVISLLIAGIALWRPHHLVYGEAGHRAERRLKFGTERQALTEAELTKIPSVEANRQLPKGPK